MQTIAIGDVVRRPVHPKYGHTDARFSADAQWRVIALQLDGALATLELVENSSIRCAAATDSLTIVPAAMVEIAVIQESSIGDDDAPEYVAHIPADEIERRRGCINYGAVSRVRMQLDTFEQFLLDGKVSFTLTRLDATTARLREYDSMLDESEAVTLHADASGMFDLAPLGWEFYPAERYL